MTDSLFQYKLEAEKSVNNHRGYKEFNSLGEALEFMDSDGMLRATFHHNFYGDILIRTVSLLKSEVKELDEKAVLGLLDNEALSIVQAMRNA